MGKKLDYFDLDWQYNADTKTFTLKPHNGNDVYQITSGSNQVLKNGNPIEPMSYPLTWHNGTRYLPLTFLAEISGKELVWDHTNRTVSFNNWTEPVVENGVLTSYNTPNKVVDLSHRTDIKELGADVFHYTGSHLEKIILPESLEKIGLAAFANTAIKEIHIPDRVNYIEGMAFNGCRSLEYIYLPDNLTKLDSETFSDCPLRELIIPPKVTEIVGENMFNAVPGLTDPAPLERIVIPPSVVKISPAVFSGCGDFVIEGLPGSYAETFAKENDIPFKALTEQALNEIIANR